MSDGGGGDGDRLPVVRVGELEEPDPERRFLVDALWARAAVGIVGGAPKCCKSWLALDIAVSVASDTACLGAFDVKEPGPALIYMAEDAAPIVKARIGGVCQSRGVSLDFVPVHVITAPTLRLDSERDRRRLRETVGRLRPRMLLLDPFVRLHRLDENHAGDVSGLLAYLRELQREHDLAVVVVHHSRKNGGSAQPGQDLRGSGDFHAWSDSSLYLRRKGDRLLLGIEHRAAPAAPPLSLVLAGDDDTGDVHLEIADEHEDGDAPPGDDLDDRILAALRDRPRTRTDLRGDLRVRNDRLGPPLRRLHDAGRIRRQGERWHIVPVPAP